MRGFGAWPLVRFVGTPIVLACLAYMVIFSIILVGGAWRASSAATRTAPPAGYDFDDAILDHS